MGSSINYPGFVTKSAHLADTSTDASISCEEATSSQEAKKNFFQRDYNMMKKAPAPTKSKLSLALQTSKSSSSANGTVQEDTSSKTEDFSTKSIKKKPDSGVGIACVHPIGFGATIRLRFGFRFLYLIM
ncbi:ADM_collapsed_G0043910.mRNA.1.CDS.1 [Saccharomyces cerevisiae]|nr:ADM_collapsed_G0043910.mRNA.1.CDS.1 [Saccharomyces cerevisiae]